jgi:rhamnosyltransferase
MTVHTLDEPEASVVVLTLNAGPEFASILDGVIAQHTLHAFEVVVVDSGSTDGTQDVAIRARARLLNHPGQFRHGSARNWAARHARGRYVAFLVQDAIPLDCFWLDSMLDDLRQDMSVAGVYSRQLPHPGADPMTSRQTMAWLTGRMERIVTSWADIEDGKISPHEVRCVCNFDNVSSCIRRAVLDRLPFQDVSFAEDLYWGTTVLKAGQRIVYEPKSAVIHSHRRSLEYERERASRDAAAVASLFGPGAVAISDPVSTLTEQGLRELDHEWALVRDIVLQEPDLTDGATECSYRVEELEHLTGMEPAFHGPHLDSSERLGLGLLALLRGPAHLAGKLAGVDQATGSELWKAYCALMENAWNGRAEI